jgi:hypothetical protein
MLISIIDNGSVSSARATAEAAEPSPVDLVRSRTDEASAYCRGLCLLAEEEK